MIRDNKYENTSLTFSILEIKINTSIDKRGKKKEGLGEEARALILES